MPCAKKTFPAKVAAKTTAKKFHATVNHRYEGVIVSATRTYASKAAFLKAITASTDLAMDKPLRENAATATLTFRGFWNKWGMPDASPTKSRFKVLKAIRELRELGWQIHCKEFLEQNFVHLNESNY